MSVLWSCKQHSTSMKGLAENQNGMHMPFMLHLLAGPPLQAAATGAAAFLATALAAVFFAAGRQNRCQHDFFESYVNEHLHIQLGSLVMMVAL